MSEEQWEARCGGDQWFTVTKVSEPDVDRYRYAMMHDGRWLAFSRHDIRPVAAQGDGWEVGAHGDGRFMVSRKITGCVFGDEYLSPRGRIMSCDDWAEGSDRDTLFPSESAAHTAIAAWRAKQKPGLHERYGECLPTPRTWTEAEIVAIARREMGR